MLAPQHLVAVHLTLSLEYICSIPPSMNNSPNSFTSEVSSVLANIVMPNVVLVAAWSHVHTSITSCNVTNKIMNTTIPTCPPSSCINPIVNLRNITTTYRDYASSQPARTVHNHSSQGVLNCPRSGTVTCQRATHALQHLHCHALFMGRKVMPRVH